MNIETSIKQLISEALQKIYGVELPPHDVTLQYTIKDYEGDYTLTTFSFSKTTKTAPDKIAHQIGEYILSHSDIIEKFNVVKGFLNLSVHAEQWKEYFVQQILCDDFASFPLKQEKVMVEYSSPNTNKPLHLGHLRNNFLGWSVAEILKTYGFSVIKANLINDRGIHICKSMLAYMKYGHGETPESSGLKGDHLVGKYYVEFDKQYRTISEELKSKGWNDEDIEKKHPLIVEAQNMLRKWEEGDKEVIELWKKMNSWVYDGFNETYKKTGIDFDKIYYESETYLEGKKWVEEGLKKNIFYKKEDGSVWIDLTHDGLDQKLLLRADGTSVYITQDIGTAEIKYRDYGCTKSIYVVGDEQEYHFKVLKLILQKMQRPYAEGIYHLSYGMVDLPSGKMKSREGTVVDADDLIEELFQKAKEETEKHGKTDTFSDQEANELYHMLAMGALKYFLLKVDPKKRMLFNPAESVDLHGNTGPFIQYTHARICAIRRKAESDKLNYSSTAISTYTRLHKAETELIKYLSRFPAAIEEAALSYSPSVIAQYVYELAKEYNRFYTELSIFNAETAEAVAFRVALSVAAGNVIKKAMYMLGIRVPERM
ncbi:MAG: arginine--tRNA ligase [Cytophagaceae bacterium]|nr:arginine--tRNA ligase [Cytophagaceae bacterium]MDW8456405.1 arginine--tRNA ligase [Cytophagaceae bacterium]